MVLPRDFTVVAGCFITRQTWFATVPGRLRPGNRLRRSPSASTILQCTSKFHPARTNRLHPSQNAAALLTDLGEVGIR